MEAAAFTVHTAFPVCIASQSLGCFAVRLFTPAPGVPGPENLTFISLKRLTLGGLKRTGGLGSAPQTALGQFSVLVPSSPAPSEERLLVLDVTLALWEWAFLALLRKVALVHLFSCFRNFLLSLFFSLSL